MSSQEQLDILYRDEHLVAINKPAGLLVHRLGKPTTGEQTTIKSPLENNFSQLISTLGWQPFG